LPHFYSIASLFIHDSRDEPWGVSIQEAISCNVPVIASDKVGSAYDLIENGQNGFIYESGKYHELALNIIKALNLNSVAIINSNKKILNNWTYEIILSNLKRGAISNQ
jgi:glycosyltransferase involved in cell wall biosynthesis